MTKVENLFQPIRVGRIELKNRLAMLGVHTRYAANGRVTDRLKNFYAERAKGGAGLLVTGIIMPANLGRPDDVGIWKDGLIPGLRELTEVAHRHGAKIAAQLALQYEWRKSDSVPLELVGPTDIQTRPRVPPPRALTVDEIHQIVEEFGEGTRRARDAGFDAVEFAGGIGYLINRFLSPCTNKRTDEYGGSLGKRLRFLLEIIDSARKKAGDDYTLMCRISADEFMEGGHGLEDTKQVAPLLERAGIALLNVQAGWHEAPVPLIQSSVPRGAFVYLAEEVKKVVNVPVMAGYRINDPLLADQIVAEGKADLVGMARPLIADPELPNKAQEGRFEDIRRCIACCHCLDMIMEEVPLVCSVNARVGREAEYTIEPTPHPRRVLVVGGGPAGMEAARIAGVRGHQVTLSEKRDRLGGQLLVAAVPPFKGEIANLTNYLTNQVNKTGVQVKLGEEATTALIEQAKPDVVVLAAGATPIIPDLPGVEGSNVATALDVLTGQREVGETVVIVGGGMVGCETAEFLAEKGKKVTIVEQMERIGADIGRTTRWVIMGRLRKAGIRMETRAKVEEITEKGVRVSRDGASEFFEGDNVVLAVGLKPNDKLAREMEGRSEEIHIVGDCVEPLRIAQAIEGGLRVAREI